MFAKETENRVTLETIRISLQYQKVTREITDISKFKIPVQQSVPRPRVKYSKRQETPIKELAALFHEIELEVIEQGQKKAWDSAQIRIHVISKVATPSTYLYKNLKNYKWSVGILRTKYNRGLLFDSQPKPYLLSLRYNDDGYILKKGSRMTYASFDDCYNQCLEYKIADPRFVDPETLNLIRLRLNDGDSEFKDWTVAPKDYIEERERFGPLYNKLEFPEGLGKAED